MAQTLAQALASACRARGVRRTFGVPGGASSLDVIDAFAAEDIDFVLTHGETAATLMAAVTAELGGAPGVAVTGVGPGAASAVNGIAYAALERAPCSSSPMRSRSQRRATTPCTSVSTSAPSSRPCQGLRETGARRRAGRDRPAARCGGGEDGGPGAARPDDRGSHGPRRARLRQAEGGEDGRQVVRPRHAGGGARPARRLSTAPDRRRHGSARAGGERGTESARAGARLPGDDHLQGEGARSPTPIASPSAASPGPRPMRVASDRADLLIFFGLDPVELLPGPGASRDEFSPSRLTTATTIRPCRRQR